MLPSNWYLPLPLPNPLESGTTLFCLSPGIGSQWPGTTLSCPLCIGIGSQGQYHPIPPHAHCDWVFGGLYCPIPPPHTGTGSGGLGTTRSQAPTLGMGPGAWNCLHPALHIGFGHQNQCKGLVAPNNCVKNFCKMFPFFQWKCLTSFSVTISKGRLDVLQKGQEPVACGIDPARKLVQSNPWRSYLAWGISGRQLYSAAHPLCSTSLC